MKHDISKITAPKMPKLGRGLENVALLLSQVSKDMHQPLVPMLFPDFVIASPKNLHQRVWRFSDALPSTLSECIHPCSEVA